jgi:hypothetical protein
VALVGNPAAFAVESSITEAYETPSLVGLGAFLVHVGGHCYGRRAQDSTHLAHPLDGIKRRIEDRGRHVAPFSQHRSAAEIAHAFRNAVYAEQQDPDYFGLAPAGFEALIVSNQVEDWNPDAAFDDGSHILQFDVDDRVRLIAYKSWTLNDDFDPATLQDVWLPSDVFYATLQRWHDVFCAEWSAAPTVSHSVTLFPADSA